MHWTDYRISTRGLIAAVTIIPALSLSVPNTGHADSPTNCPTALPPYRRTAEVDDGRGALSACPTVRPSDSLRVRLSAQGEKGKGKGEGVPPYRPDADPQPLFASHDILEVTLKFDLLTVRRDVGEDREEHPATLSYTDENGALVALEATVKTRGRFRRDTRNCEFPPLRLDLKKGRFPEGQLDGTLFENQNELKLVCHCQDNSEAHEQFVLKEYLAYRVYQLFTEMSFSVRLARVTYVDAMGRRDPFTRFAFFIEDEKMMAERNDAVVLDSMGVRQMELDDAQATLFSFFQYFIGNTDWKVSVLHNVKLLDQNIGFPVAVPYDFDWAGAVDPPYAAPHPDLGTNDVRERVFISPCRTDYDIGRVIDMFNERKDQIYALYTGLSALEERSLQRSIGYIDEFYEVLSDPEAVRREFVRSCPGG